MSYYNYIKALHLIFVITWFAGLFYMPRLFIYWIEAQQKQAPARNILTEQLKLMAYRLWYIITWPSAVLAILFALALLYLMPSWLVQSWMWIKLAFVGVLIVYHLKTHMIFRQMQRGVYPYSVNFMRIWNEVTSVILVSVVFLVVLKNTVNWIKFTTGTIIFIILILVLIKLYKRIRN